MARVFIAAREKILKRPEALLSLKEIYVFDLYVRAGKVYSKIYRLHYRQLKDMLLEGNHGVVNGLEKAGNIRRPSVRPSRKRVAYCTRLRCGWLFYPVYMTLYPGSSTQNMLIYVFGGRDYTQFIKKTQAWKNKGGIKFLKVMDEQG